MNSHEEINAKDHLKCQIVSKRLQIFASIAIQYSWDSMHDKCLHLYSYKNGIKYAV